MKRKYIIMAVILLSGAFAVYYYAVLTNPKNKILPENVSEYKEKLGDSLTRLSEDDKKLLIQYVMRHSMAKVFGGGEQYKPITIGQAIEEQKSFVSGHVTHDAEKDKLKAEVETERKAKIDEVNKTITVTYLGKKVMKDGYRDFIETKIAYQNNSQKDISGIKGRYVFKDVFGDTIIGIRSSMDRTIKAGDKYVENGKGIDYNQFMDTHQRFRDTPDDKIQFEFVPEMIVFTDGSKLDIPSAND